MNENNFIDEAQINELYDDVIDQPVQVADTGDGLKCIFLFGWIKNNCLEKF